MDKLIEELLNQSSLSVFITIRFEYWYKNPFENSEKNNTIIETHTNKIVELIKNLNLKILSFIVVEFGKNNKPHYHIILCIKNILGFNDKFLYNIKNYFTEELNEYDIVVDLLTDFNNYKNKFKYIFKECNSKKILNFYTKDIKKYEYIFENYKQIEIITKYTDKFENLNSYSTINKKYDEYTLINLINFYLQYKDLFLFNKILYTKVENKIMSYKKFVEIEKLHEYIKTFFVDLYIDFKVQLDNIDIYALQIQFVPKIEQMLKKTQEIIINTIKLNFNIIEFNDGIYIINRNKFIPKKWFNNNNLLKIGTLKYYNKTYKHLSIPKIWKELIIEALDNTDIANEFFHYYASIFNKNDNCLGKKRTMYIVGEASTGKTTLTTKLIFQFYGKENVGLISNSNLFGFENIINKQIIVCDEAHHHVFNTGQILKLLEKENPLLIERKHKEAIAIEDNKIIFISNKELEIKEEESKKAIETRLKTFIFKKRLSENTDNYGKIIKNIKNEEINIIIYCNKLFFKKYKEENNIKKKTLIKDVLKALPNE